MSKKKWIRFDIDTFSKHERRDAINAEEFRNQHGEDPPWLRIYSQASRTWKEDNTTKRGVITLTATVNRNSCNVLISQTRLIASLGKKSNIIHLQAPISRCITTNLSWKQERGIRGQSKIWLNNPDCWPQSQIGTLTSSNILTRLKRLCTSMLTEV